jgi:hypothetical protein
MNLFGEDDSSLPPFETADLRDNLRLFLDKHFAGSINALTQPVGNYKWGVYAFFDYDGEPIYVGQTNERLRTRIRRHLTNQRTDAVAMSVLDPFEVFEIEVWPLPQFEGLSGNNAAAKAYLGSLENLITAEAVAASRFGAILNEKDPPPATVVVERPASLRGRIVSDKVAAIRAHPDFRVARRAMITARLAQVISEREVRGGLRRVLLTQTKRLNWLAERRFEALGGQTSVERKSAGENEDED